MSKTRPNVAAVALAAMLAMASADAAETQDVLVRELSSPDLSVRRQIARELLPPRLFELESALAVRASLLAARDADPWIRQVGLGGLALMMTAARVTEAPDLQDPALAALVVQIEVRERLIATVREDADEQVAVAAAVPLMMAFGRDASSASVVLDRLETLGSARYQVKLLHTLTIVPLTDEGSIKRVARYLDNGAMPVRREAADVLLTLPMPPRERFDSYLRLIESPETYADPALVKALPRFNLPASRYLPRLVAMKARLAAELAKPPEQRTITVYNDDFVRRTLDEAIASERTRTGLK
ncbi:MAG: hypothetical protein ACREXP_13635 [Steroidobacteraceae bacterium]